MKSLNRVPLFATPGMVATRLLHPWDSPGKSTGVDCHFLLQGIVLTQGLNPGLLHCRRTLYPLSHQGTPQTVSQPPIQRGGEGPRAEAPPSSLALPARSRRQAARCHLGDETGFQLVLRGASQAGSPAPSALNCSLFYSQATLGTDISL